MRWFGERWNNNCCTSDEKVQTPVGVKCDQCQAFIVEGDQGVVLATTTIVYAGEEGLEVKMRPWHLDCLLKKILPQELEDPKFPGLRPITKTNQRHTVISKIPTIQAHVEELESRLQKPVLDEFPSKSIAKRVAIQRESSSKTISKTHPSKK